MHCGKAEDKKSVYCADGNINQRLKKYGGLQSPRRLRKDGIFLLYIFATPCREWAAASVIHPSVVHQHKAHNGGAANLPPAITEWHNMSKTHIKNFAAASGPNRDSLYLGDLEWLDPPADKS